MEKDMIQVCDLLCVSHHVADHVVERHVALSDVIGCWERMLSCTQWGDKKVVCTFIIRM